MPPIRRALSCRSSRRPPRAGGGVDPHIPRPCTGIRRSNLFSISEDGMGRVSGCRMMYPTSGSGPRWLRWIVFAAMNSVATPDRPSFATRRTVVVVQQQVPGSFVGRNAADKASVRCGTKACARRRPLPGGAAAAVRSRANRARAYSTSVVLRGPELPELGVGDPMNVRSGTLSSQPTVLATRFCPQVVGRSRVPRRHVGRRWSRDRSGYRAAASAETAVERGVCSRLRASGSPHSPSAPADCQIGHVKGSDASVGLWRPRASKS